MNDTDAIESRYIHGSVWGIRGNRRVGRCTFSIDVWLARHTEWMHVQARFRAGVVLPSAITRRLQSLYTEVALGDKWRCYDYDVYYEDRVEPHACAMIETVIQLGGADA